VSLRAGHYLAVHCTAMRASVVLFVLFPTSLALPLPLGSVLHSNLALAALASRRNLLLPTEEILPECELQEEHEQRGDVYHVCLGQCSGEQAVGRESDHAPLPHHRDELCHLRQRDELPREHDAHQGESVVRVHEAMDGTIQQNCHIDIRVEADVDVDPVKGEDGEVVVNVKDRELVVLPLDDDKQRVKEIQYLRDVEHPKDELKVGGFVIGEDGIAREHVQSVPSMDSVRVHCHPRAQEYLRVT